MEILSAINPVRVYGDLVAFLETGGNVLVVIMIATFFLWLLIVERYWYFWTTHGGLVRRARRQWEERSDHTSWGAHRIRELLISEVKLETRRSLELIKTMVAVAPLLGLLGTVVGMVEVFDVMAISGSSNARAMAAGVSKATLPTMAGMVVSLSGLYFSNQLDQRAEREVDRVADALELR
jgi:biopolymer transport protein ExbB